MRGGVALFAVLFIALTGTPLAVEDKALEGREAVTTAKERMVDKAADRQRVDDCKVPEAERDTAHDRPDDCRHVRGKEDAGGPGSDG
ncbi:MAG: hypothetical protein HC871_12070 [Rhizobiales bacterium]|nr:hypothetical protein [Hyphomicrobiales bacterium]